jgi:hypothetical protein
LAFGRVGSSAALPPVDASAGVAGANSREAAVPSADSFSALAAALNLTGESRESPSPGSDAAPIRLSTGVSVDAGVAQLISVMAGTSSGDRGFDPSSPVAPPDDTSQRQIIAAALHP